MKEVFRTITVIYLISGIAFMSLWFALPKDTNAQLETVAGNFGTCALEGTMADRFQSILGDLGLGTGSLGDLFGGGGILGGAGGGMGNEVPVVDDDQIDFLTDILTTGVSQLEQLTSLQIKEYMLDCIVWAISDGYLETITGSTIGWINTGFGGEPFYITDPDAFFAGIEDRTVELYLDDLSSAPIPSSFKDDVLSAFTQSRTRVSLNDIVACDEGDIDTLSDITDPDDSWDTYVKVMTNPACTPLGSYELISNEADRRIALIQGEAAFYAQTGDGFLPELEEGEVVTPGSVIKNQLNDIIESGVTEIENADELSEVIGILGSLVSGILGDSISLRDVDTTVFTGDSVLGGGTYTFPGPGTPPPPSGGGGAGSFADSRIEEMQTLIQQILSIVSSDSDLSSSQRSSIINYLNISLDYLDDLDIAVQNNNVFQIALALDQIEDGLDSAEDRYDNCAIGCGDETILEDITENQIRPIWEDIRDEFGVFEVWNVI